MPAMRCARSDGFPAVELFHVRCGNVAVLLRLQLHNQFQHGPITLKVRSCTGHYHDLGMHAKSLNWLCSWTVRCLRVAPLDAHSSGSHGTNQFANAYASA